MFLNFTKKGMEKVTFAGRPWNVVTGSQASKKSKRRVWYGLELKDATPIA